MDICLIFVYRVKIVYLSVGTYILIFFLCSSSLKLEDRILVLQIFKKSTSLWIFNFSSFYIFL